MNERSQKAFDFASDASKQILTLATGIIALTITFSNDVLGGVPDGDRLLLKWAWAAYLLSILFGVMTLLALTGTLGHQEPDDQSTSIYGSNVRVPAGLQLLGFVVGLVLTVAFGIRAF